MYYQTFWSLLNLTKPELEIKLVENVGGGQVLVKHEASLKKNDESWESVPTLLTPLATLKNIFSSWLL